MDSIADANELLRAKGYAERDLGVFPALRGKALLKGSRIVSPLSDEAGAVLGIVRDAVPTAADLGRKTLRPADLRTQL